MLKNTTFLLLDFIPLLNAECHMVCWKILILRTKLRVFWKLTVKILANRDIDEREQYGINGDAYAEVWLHDPGQRVIVTFLKNVMLEKKVKIYFLFSYAFSHLCQETVGERIVWAQDIFRSSKE